MIKNWIIIILSVLLVSLLSVCIMQKKGIVLFPKYDESRINAEVLDYFDLTHGEAIQKFGGIKASETFGGGAWRTLYNDGTLFEFAEYELNFSNKPVMIYSDKFLVKNNHDDHIYAHDLDDIFGQQPLFDFNYHDGVYYKRYSYKGHSIYVSFDENTRLTYMEIRKKRFSKWSKYGYE